jgi:hypothetical protein
MSDTVESDAWLVTATRGKFGKESIMIRGDIKQWLTDKKARPTKDPLRFVVGGWRVIVVPVGEETLSSMHSIFGDDKYAPEKKEENV